MKQIHADLWQTKIYSSGMLNCYAYFLATSAGNVLFYSTNDEEEFTHMESLGGIKYQLLTHRDEAGPSLARIKNRFNSKLMFSELESEAIAKHARADLFFETEDHKLDDIQVIHTPGHTKGSVCFFYQSPHGKSYLFTGDTFFQWNGEWATLICDGAGGSKDALKSSLQKLRNLRPDVVMSSGFVGDIALVEPTEQEWTQAIDDEINKLS